MERPFRVTENEIIDLADFSRIAQEENKVKFSYKAPERALEYEFDTEEDAQEVMLEICELLNTP